VAIAMPFCHHGQVQHAQASDIDHGDHAAAHSEPNSPVPGCEDCTYCQACASAALPSAVTDSSPISHAAYDARGMTPFLCFIPEQPHRPPLAA
jgi:hypothetical protein